MKRILFHSIYLTILTTLIFAQELYVPRNIEQAYQKQTRSQDGRPGTNYWQNRADYKIDINFDPISGIVSGTETITYFNNSPDKLDSLVLQLFPNVYKKGNPREFAVDPSDETDGVLLKSISVNGNARDLKLQKDMHYRRDGLSLSLFYDVAPGSVTELQISWQYTPNRNSHMRTGQVDSTSWFIAYFFPRVAVYDDIDGWADFQYTGIAEFYNDFGDFELSVTVPRHYVVWATGMLQNAAEVLREPFLGRYRQALNSDAMVHIIDSTECSGGQVTNAASRNTWRFAAENVSDVAFALSDHYCWDASSLVVDKNTGRRTLIDAAFNKDSQDFYQVAKIARQAIGFMSGEIPGVPFPYPQETVFNGLDEMEYPMMVNNASFDDPHYVIKLTSHEIFHSYFPFYMGINETAYAWMDEGFASFGDFLIASAIDAPEQANFYFQEIYEQLAGDHPDTPIFTHSEYLKRPVYNMNSYVKTATFLLILKDLLGDKEFKTALHAYMERWNGKHPTPYDFFHTFNRVSGRNLNWLIRPWFYEFGYVDFGIGEQKREGSAWRITVEKKGRYPAPFDLKIEFDDGSTETVHRKADVWKNGEKYCTVEIESAKEIKTVSILKSAMCPVRQ